MTRYADKVLWSPSAEEVARAHLTAFTSEINRRYGLNIRGYDELHRWSVEERPRFWESVWRYADLRASRPWDEVVRDGDRMPGARWFIGARLNYAENLLRRRGPGDALVFRGEGGHRRRISHDELYSVVARLAGALRRAGVQPGDRVAGFMPNLPETIAAMLAASAVGAVWSSCRDQTKPSLLSESPHELIGQRLY